jgi:hypothetical protein
MGWAIARYFSTAIISGESVYIKEKHPLKETKIVSSATKIRECTFWFSVAYN